MPDRTRFLQLNDLAKQGRTLANLIWPFAGGRHNWPPDAAQLWPSAYDEWCDACRALLDPDLWQLFERTDQGDRQQPGVRNAIELLVEAITAGSEQSEQAQLTLHKRFHWTPLAEIFDEQRELVETARRRAFPVTGAVPDALKAIVAASQRRFVDGRIDFLFTEHGCEPHWWVPALHWHERQTERRVHGWFTAIQVFAPEREVVIVRGVVAQVLREGRVSDADRVVLEAFLAQSQPAAPPAVAPAEESPTAACFISYSSRDQAIARRLHADLQAHNVRCWFAPHDMQIGDSIIDRIDQSIRDHPKMLLILSEASIASAWVAAEVKMALMRERAEGGTLLFPVRIDDAVFQPRQGWAAQLQERHIGDFCSWKDADAYWMAFQRLLRDLLN